mmetsp:Transcript_5318/g.11732  ORF Transcript_5318/g.11732 Transcript_5318/m.11732 type:complete len:82 (+) Transcript_5318:2061-2306(+)
MLVSSPWLQVYSRLPDWPHELQAWHSGSFRESEFVVAASELDSEVGLERLDGWGGSFGFLEDSEFGVLQSGADSFSNPMEL